MTKLLAKNRRAGFDYDLSEKMIAGLVLTGAEVKSIKAGHASLKGSYITIREGEAWLVNAHVTPYQTGGQRSAPDPTRNRKLLLQRPQLNALIGSKQEGLSAVPIALLQQRGFVKLEIGIGRGKKRYDKRAALKRREADREARREMARH